MNKTIIKTALEEAQKAFDTDEIPVGAVLFETNTGKIIAMAHNQTEKMNDISAHAEILALREGGQILKTNHFVNLITSLSRFSNLEVLEAVGYANAFDLKIFEFCFYNRIGLVKQLKPIFTFVTFLKCYFEL